MQDRCAEKQWLGRTPQKVELGCWGRDHSVLGIGFTLGVQILLSCWEPQFCYLFGGATIVPPKL